MSAGDLLVVHCWFGVLPYSHYSIDMGDGTVIQLATDPDRSETGSRKHETMCVRRSTMEAFAAGRSVHVVEVEQSLPVAEVLERAVSLLGTTDYSLISANCEHFARWCKTGLWESEQVRETHQSLLRTAFHAASLLAGGAGRSVALHRAVGMTLSARLAIPSLAGEISEQVTKCTLKRRDAAPEMIDRTGKAVGYGAVALLGLVMGGAVGSVSAVAFHSLAKRAAPPRG